MNISTEMMKQYIHETAGSAIAALNNLNRRAVFFQALETGAITREEAEQCVGDVSPASVTGYLHALTRAHLLTLEKGAYTPNPNTMSLLVEYLTLTGDVGELLTGERVDLEDTEGDDHTW